MKRGMELEKRFDGWLENLNRLGLLAIRLEIRTRLEVRTDMSQRLEVKTDRYQKIYLKKQPADYIIVGKKIWLLDSKECSCDAFYPSSQPSHQVDSMIKMQSLGHRAGFVVWFRKHDPVGVNLRLIETFDKPATIESGIRFDWQTLV